MQSFNQIRLKVLLIIGLNILCAPSTIRGQSSLESVIQSYLEEHALPGLAVTVMKGDDIIFSKGYGYSDLENNTPVSPETSLFRIGSVSKSFTAAAMGHLHEIGKLDYDDEIQAYVSWFPDKKYEVSVRDVAGHIGGIRNYAGDEYFNKEHFETVREGVEIFSSDPLVFEPGSDYQYSSHGFNLLSAVVESAADHEFVSYMRDSVFLAMDMDHTWADEVDRILPGRGEYYEREVNDFVPGPYVDNSYKWAGGGFLSTSEDVAKFAHAHLTGAYVTDDTFEEIITPQSLTDGSKTRYGIGWFNDVDEKGYHWVGHAGGSVGGTTMMACYPESELIVVTITNLTQAGITALANQIAWYYLEN